MKAKVIPTTGNFKPIDVTITIETEEELQKLVALLGRLQKTEFDYTLHTQLIQHCELIGVDPAKYQLRTHLLYVDSADDEPELWFVDLRIDR